MKRLLVVLALVLACAISASAVDITFTITTSLDNELTLERQMRNAEACAVYGLARACGQVALRTAHCLAIGKETGCPEALDRIFQTNQAWVDYLETQRLQARQNERIAREKRIKAEADQACIDKGLEPGCTLGQ